MRYWWVNQNQTFRQEIEGGYLWSPKRNKNGHRNPFYEFMREVAPGDIVLSFSDTRIAALGIVSGYCRESPKPEEFGTAGTNWSQIGWRVGVRWQRLANAVRPKDHIARLRPHLASKYAPLTPEGNGLQSVYLTEISRGLAWTLFELIGAEARQVDFNGGHGRRGRAALDRQRSADVPGGGDGPHKICSDAGVRGAAFGAAAHGSTLQ